MSIEPDPTSTNDPTSVKEFTDSLAIAREEVLTRIVNSSMYVCGAGFLLAMLQLHAARSLVYALAAVIFYGISIQTGWSIQKRGSILLAMLGAAAAASIWVWGMMGPGAIFLVALPPLAILLFGDRVTILAVTGAVLTWLAAGLIFALTGLPATPIDIESIPEWVSSSLNLLLVMMILVHSQRQSQEVQTFVIDIVRQKRDLFDMHSELLRQTKQLDYERYLLHTLLDTVSDRIFFKDLSGRYTRISHAVAQQYKLEPSRVIGKTDFDFYSFEYASQVQAREKAMLASGIPEFDVVEREIWRDGRPASWAITSRLPLKGPDDKIVGWFGTARDITDIKKAQEADQRNAQLLTTIAEVGRAVTSSLELQALLHTLGELVQSAFGFYGVNVWLITEGSTLVRLEAGHSPTGEELGMADIQLSFGSPYPVIQVCESGTHYLNNQFNPQTGFPLFSYFPASRAHMILPLRIAGKVLGALEILSEQPDVFGEQDLLLLRSLADQVTIAIRNASLYQSEKSRRRLAETLYEVGQALSSTINLSEVLELILHSLSEIVHSDRSTLLLLEGQDTLTPEDDRDILHSVAERGFPEELTGRSLRVPLQANDVFQEIHRRKQPLALVDVQQRPDWQNLEGLAQTRSWLGVPLMNTDRVIGMLSLARTDLNPYTLSETTLASTFAGQASLALENARLYDSVKRFSHQLEEMVQERTEELSAAYGQLERLDKTKSNFIKIVSHELRTPITVLQGYSQILQGDELVKDNAHLRQIADGVQTGSMRLQEIINTMLDIAKIDSSALELSPEPVSLASILHDMEKKYWHALKDRKLAFRLENIAGLPHIEADISALYKVFSELVGNAIKYTPDGGQITVAGCYIANSAEFPEGAVEVVVRDSGIGLDPAAQELIFTKFYQTGEVALHSSSKTKFKGGGPGLGLPIARGIVQAHQGKLWVESPGCDEAACPGSQFFVQLPLRQNPRPRITAAEDKRE